MSEPLRPTVDRADDPRLPAAGSDWTRRFDELLAASGPDVARAQLDALLAHARQHGVSPGAITTARSRRSASPSPMVTSPGSRGSVLVVDDDDIMRLTMAEGLRASGFDVVEAASGAEALARLDEAIPDVIVSDVMMPGQTGFELVTAVRAHPLLRTVPLLFVTTRARQDDIVEGLHLGADDYLVKPFALPEFVARVSAKVTRPSMPADAVSVERSTGALTHKPFLRVLARERGRHGGRGVVVHVRIAELDGIRGRFGARGASEVERQVTATLHAALGSSDVVGRDAAGAWAVLLADLEPDEAESTLRALAVEINDTPARAAGASLRLTPAIGYQALDAVAAEPALDDVALASDAALAHLDLLPVAYTAELAAAAQRQHQAKRAQRFGRLRARLRTPMQILITMLVGLVVPYFVYWISDRNGFDAAGIMYIVVVITLVTTGVLIWAEGFAALRRRRPPEEPATPYPPASAIIAAYLPNEAPTIIETLESFLAIDYPAGLQIILAYNTPVDHPIEHALHELAATDPRLVPFRVMDSTSKAQNVNAALAIATGEFVGVFDADHHPDPSSFRRAWRWISHGADVVQGHPVVRNGDASWVARMVAVEFEAIYSVSHPGRARIHDFGIFGGSNGFWRTDLLRSTRMRGRMLTEDIDSSLRVVGQGHVIVSDPELVSRELATTTLQQLWNQRMRWAQGWFQVSLRHTLAGVRSPHLSVRQKFGFVHLLVWREIYPWLSLQMFPIIAWFTFGQDRSLDWKVPIFVLTTLFTLSVGPGQALFAYKLATPEIKAHRSWFLSYFVLATVFYTEYKNLIARVSQVKEVMGDRQWKVTPRTTKADDA